MLNPKVVLTLAALTLIAGICWVVVRQDKSELPKAQEVIEEQSPFDHTLVFVGDSMTEYLGNFDELRAHLKESYPEEKVLFLNYGYSANSVLSLQERIEKDTQHSGRTFQAINDINFDYIFIESMGNNPLSEFPLEEGLKKQTEALERVVKTLEEKHPKSSIIFVATIAPSRNKYGTGAVDLSTEKRREWADERIRYIQNHIDFANKNNIPLINIFEDSKINGDGNVNYLNQADFIHPSPTGIRFISQELADFIVENKLF